MPSTAAVAEVVSGTARRGGSLSYYGQRQPDRGPNPTRMATAAARPAAAPSPPTASPAVDVQFGYGSRWVRVQPPLSWHGTLTPGTLGVADPAPGVVKYAILRLSDGDARRDGRDARDGRIQQQQQQQQQKLYVAREKETLPR